MSSEPRSLDPQSLDQESSDQESSDQESFGQRSFDPHGYISFETALSAHGVLDDLVHAVRIATSADDRRLRVPGIGLVEWIALPDDLLFGDRPGTPLDFPGLRLAEPEKALCDLLWLCESRGLAPPLCSLRLEELDPDRLAAHARRMGLNLSVLRPEAPPILVSPPILVAPGSGQYYAGRHGEAV